jgi:ABC-type antimicrobial peptide transport system, permease component
MRSLASEYPATNGGRGAALVAIRDEVLSGIERPLLVLFGAVALMLLIACANVASLVLARSIERGREIALRSALGASRARLMRQLVTESLVLSFIGAAAGLWAASVGVRLLVDAMPAAMLGRTPSLRDASVDLVALAFTGIVAVGTAVLVGLAPAVLASRRSAAALIGSPSRTGAGRAQHRLRDALVTAEVALTLVLLVGAALMGRSMAALLDVDPGFRADQVATARVALAGPEYAAAERQQRLFEELLARVRALPGVQQVGAVSSLPLQGSGSNGYDIAGGPASSVARRPEAVTRAVGGDYLGALRIPLLQGRALDARDDRGSGRAVVVSAALVRRTFDGRAALNERLRVDGWGDSVWTIVGVVGDVRTGRLDEPAVPVIYYSHLQRPTNRMSIVARTSGDLATLAGSIRREAHALDATVAVYSAGTMAEQVEQSPAVSSRQYPLVLLGSFAAVALILAVCGVYGVIAYAVAQRTREIAVRIALGAAAAQVMILVMRSGLRVIVAGVALGSLAALGVTRAMASLLYGISAADAATYLTAAALLVIVGAVASYLPARKAMRLDPATALRTD